MKSEGSETLSWETIDRDDVLMVAQAGAARHITFARPDALNAFDERLQDRAHAAITAAAADPTVRALLLTGAGRAFSSGADLNIPDSSTSLREHTIRELTERYNPIVLALREMPKPVIAAVHGATVGVGCSIALACDLVLMGRSTRFLLAFAKVGLTIDGGASLLVGARAGLGRASRLALLAEAIDAEQALAWGLGDEIIEDTALLEHAQSTAVQLAQGPTRAFAATKRNLNAALLPELAEALHREALAQGELVDRADFRTGAAAFAERKQAHFTGL